MEVILLERVAKLGQMGEVVRVKDGFARNFLLKRGKALPDLPTVAESGYPGFEAIQWYGLVVPGATSKSIVSRIHKDSVKALQHADVRAAMERLGLGQEPSTPEQLRARIKKETATWAGLIKDAGIRVQ